MDDETQNFLRLLMHDLAAPVRQTSGFLDLIALQLQGEDQAKAREFLDFAQKANHRMKLLVKTVHDYVKLDDYSERTTLSLTDLVQEVVEAKKERIEAKSAKISVGALPEIVGNSTMLTMLFDILLENALLYNQSETPKVEVSAQTLPDGRQQLTVKDNGIGIAADQLTEIFSPFKRLQSEADYVGSGMGLALAQKIVRLHGGEISCQSELGQGSEFLVSLAP